MLPSQKSLRLGAQARLRSKLDFDAIYAKGRRLDDRFFGLRIKPNGLGHPRVGLAVAIKTMGNAVARNRIRRLVRESFRLAQHSLPAVDIVVGAKNPAREAPLPTLRASLATLWQRVAETCASS